MLNVERWMLDVERWNRLKIITFAPEFNIQYLEFNISDLAL
jgi:hypothetical protein